MSDIRKVILYKHGVGYFEKRIKAKGSETIDFFFKSREMNDVLKSITIMDLSGGIVSSVSYDSVTPAEKLLEDISIRIPDEKSLRSLLSQIKGARIQIQVGKEILEGSVVGLDPLTRKEGETIIETDRLTILDEKGEMAGFTLEEIKSLKILDENIRKDLEFYLKTIIFSQKKDQKKLTLFTHGEGQRDILVSYVLESPVWKTTYRVVMRPKAPPLIQGWAVVDNTQDEDWEDIELSLVSGLPVSFVHDLYNPRFKRRPVVQVKDEVSVAPPSFEEGFDPEPMKPAEADYESLQDRVASPMPSRARAEAMPGAGLGAGLGMMAMMGGMGSQPAAEMASSVQVKTIAQKAGDHFEYRIMNPVTIKRNQSALVPIINGEFSGKKILIFNERNRPNNPMTCLEMTNDTQLTLEGGPVTVFEQDTYMGESMLEFTKPDEKKYLSYAVELGCHIEKMEYFSDEPVFMVTIAGGTMQTHFYKIRERLYRIKNKNKEAIQLIIEHPRETNWELVDTPEPMETTQNFYRFLYELPKEGEFTFSVKDKKTFWSHFNLTNLSEDNITFFLGRKYFDKTVAGRIRELIGLQGKKADLDRQLRERNDELSAIYKDQERLRNNIASLSASREEQSLKEKYVAKMGEQENSIETIEKAIKTLQSDIEKNTRDINEKILSLQFEKKLEEREMVRT
jgi:hypothetical protein